MKTVGERVMWARTRLGMSRYALDKLAALSFGHVSKIERGDMKDPDTTTVIKIARALFVDASWLMFGGPNPKVGK